MILSIKTFLAKRAIDSHIKNLRRKPLQAAAGHEWIRSVYGGGVFEAG